MLGRVVKYRSNPGNVGRSSCSNCDLCSCNLSGGISEIVLSLQMRFVVICERLLRVREGDARSPTSHFYSFFLLSFSFLLLTIWHDHHTSGWTTLIDTSASHHHLVLSSRASWQGRAVHQPAHELPLRRHVLEGLAHYIGTVSFQIFNPNVAHVCMYASHPTSWARSYMPGITDVPTYLLEKS